MADSKDTGHGRPPMTHAFHDKIRREEKARRSWDSTFGDIVPGHRKDVGNPGVYFTTNFPVVSTAMIGRTSWVTKEKPAPKPKPWATRNVNNSETRKSLDTTWAKESGVHVAPTRAALPTTSTLRLSADPQALSITGETKDLTRSKARGGGTTRRVNGPPRGTRAAKYHEALAVPRPPKKPVFRDAVDMMEALGGKRGGGGGVGGRGGGGGATAGNEGTGGPPQDHRVYKPAAANGTAPATAVHRVDAVPNCGSQRAASPAHAPAIRTAPRTDPSVAYLSMLWAATGRGLNSAVPELPHARTEAASPPRRIESEYRGWVAGSGEVTFVRSPVQILEGVSKYRRKPSGFVATF